MEPPIGASKPSVRRPSRNPAQGSRRSKPEQPPLGTAHGREPDGPHAISPTRQASKAVITVTVRIPHILGIEFVWSKDQTADCHADQY